ncbi:SAM-dependent methyltransferase TehB [Orbus wheelerorum]|uniref:SAM-dependent methyltransferase TehB n=1 Tax=Orbus wheelerorum TaxID=3074111 RepID=UPI00370D1D80
MLEMIKNIVSYKTLPIWNKQTLPKIFKEKHNTQAGAFAKLKILNGDMDFAILDERGHVISMHYFSTDNQPPFIAPLQWHKIVSVSDDIECQLTLYCTKEEYGTQKYDLKLPNSEVIETCKIISKGKALDLGCGSGRNALYLNLCGFDVTALDKIDLNVTKINNIITQDELKNIQAHVYDINQATLQGEYDFIMSTSVMMFLQPERIETIISNIKSVTKPKGYNLIVSAMSTDDCPSPVPVPFSFAFKEQELKNYYHDWDIIKYNENMGEIHKMGISNNKMKLRFATLLAKKNN